MSNAERKLDNNSYFIESNILARAKNNFSTAQQLNIFYVFASFVRKGDQVGQEYKTSIKEICEKCGYNQYEGAYYIRLKNDLLAMTQREWVEVGNGEIETMSFFDRVSINENSGNVTVKFDKEVNKRLIDLDGNFTKYLLDDLLPLKTKYAKRLYEILRSYLLPYRKERIENGKIVDLQFDINDLKEMLAATKYNNYTDFKRRVLKPALTEINVTGNDYFIELEEIRQGRIVTTVSFAIKQKGYTEKKTGKMETEARLVRDFKRPKPIKKKRNTGTEINDATILEASKEFASLAELVKAAEDNKAATDDLIAFLKSEKMQKIYEFYNDRQSQLKEQLEDKNNRIYQLETRIEEEKRKIEELKDSIEEKKRKIEESKDSTQGTGSC